MVNPNNNQNSVQLVTQNQGAYNQFSSGQFHASSTSSQSSLWHKNKHIIGYRAVRGYVREDLSDELKSKLNLKYVRGKGWIYDHNCTEIIFTFPRYGKRTTRIEFSIPKLLYKDRTRIATPDDARRAIELVSNLIGRDFSCFNISEFNITSNFTSLGGLELYRDLLLRTSGFSGYTIRQNSVVLHNRKDEDKSTRLLIFYKTAGIVRVEARFTSGGCASVKEQIRRHLGHNSQVSEILTEGFYDNCVHYFYDLVLNSIAYNAVGYEAEEEATIKNLQENYDYTYEPKHQVDSF